LNVKFTFALADQMCSSYIFILFR